MEIKNETSTNKDQKAQSPTDSSSAPEVKPQAVPNTQKKTVAGFAKVWIIFWMIANLGATCAPANRLMDSNLGGLYFLSMLLSAVVAVGYLLLYYKNPLGLMMILIANILGIFMNFIQVTGYSITVTTGLIIGIITYFITRKQIAYPFGKHPMTK